MPPTGPRSRPSHGTGARPSANTRNEVFENIFGRPAGGHHMGATGAGPQATGSTGVYPHGGYAASTPNVYLNPAQPSYPPTSAFPPPLPPQMRPPPHPHAQSQQHVFQAAPNPAAEGHLYQQRGVYEANNGYGRPPQGHVPSNGYVGFDNLPDRRASLANSTHSSTSSAPYHSPNPTGVTPQPSSINRLPSGSHQRMWDDLPPEPPRSQSTRRPPPNLGVNPGPFALSDAYDGTASSPASVIFPHRAGGQPPPTNRPNFPSSSSTAGSTAIMRTATTKFPTPNVDEAQRTISPPPDYIRAMGSLNFDGTGSLDLSDLSEAPPRPMRSPKRESPSVFESMMVNEDQNFRNQRAPQRRQTEGSADGPPQRHPAHQRHPSDSSIASSSYTAVAGRSGLAPLSTIGSSGESPYASPTTPTNSDSGFAANAQRRLSGRKSMESTLSLPLMGDGTLPPGAAPSENRSTSFSGSSGSRNDAVSALRTGSVGHGTTRNRTGTVGPPSSYNFPSPVASQNNLAATLGRNTSVARAAALRSMPQIYPALLSRVAEAFKQLISLSELVKDGIEYKDSFDGRTAVGVIADIIKTPDRNLALLLGRALDAQKFFHDVTYDHRLRDTANEIYQFKERLASPFMEGNDGLIDSPTSGHLNLTRRPSSTGLHSRGLVRPPNKPFHSDSGSIQTSDSQHSLSSSSVLQTPATSSTSLSHQSPFSMTTINSASSYPMGLATATDSPSLDDDGEDDLPVGVFTLLTGCYSPTCSRDSLCYSINCPRRLEQMKRLNMKPQPGLTRKLSEESLGEVKETGTLWIHSVSQEILDSVDDTEKKRQEAINEVIYTERDFVRDLEYLRDSWVKPLRTQEVITQSKRDDFVRQVFWNVHEILTVNHPLAEKLTKRQKQQPVVQSLGDLFLERVPLFEPFVTYGAHQLFGKYEFEKEKGANPAFQKFVDETERKPESRKLELNGYLTKPTTRLGRYPLLLDAVLKYTPDGHSDKRDLPEVIKMIKALLTRVNVESGKSENIFELAQLEQQLVFRPSESIDLRLRDKNRELVHKGPLKRRGGNQGDNADLMAFLFDHAFLLVKPKWVNKAEQYKVYRRPIPLELLTLITPDEHYNSAKLSATRNKLMSRPTTNKVQSATHVPPKPESKHGFSMTIVHLGKKGYSMQLWVETYVSRKKWLEAIDKQQGILRDRSCVFVPESITEGYFMGMRKINCISPYDVGRRMIYGTDEGVYFSNLRDEKLREPVKVINLLDVTQVDVIEEYQLLIVLHERSVTTFPLDCLDPNDPNAALKRGKRISSHTSFFKSGVCLGKTLVCVVKSSTLSSTIKVLEPIDQSMRGKKPQTSFMKRLNGGNDTLKVFKEFYIPTESSSVHFLKTKLCVGCTKGFEIVDLETLDMQGLLDPSDSSLDFVLKRDNVKPMAIYRIEGDFLLCYDEFAFYVNKNGWRSRPKWSIVWEGAPTAFALQYPYVIAFEPTFVEVHHVENGHLVQIIPGNNITCLFADTPPSTVNAPIPPSRQLMYPNPPPASGAMYRPPPNQSPYGQGQYQPYPGNPGMARPPYGMLPPPQPQPSPMPRLSPRQQIIFVSDDGHVQFLKLPLPAPPMNHHSTGSGGAQPRPHHVTRASR